MTAGFSGTWAIAPPSSLPTAAALPGVPAVPTTVYVEDFDNRPGSTPIARLTGYVGATGQTYSADPAWLTGCNGWVARFDQPTTTANGASAQIADCGGIPVSWNVVQQLSQALGLGAGGTSAQSRTNFAVSAYTYGNPGANKVEFQTTSNIALPTATGRFLTAQIDVAGVNCPPVATAPTLQFQLLDAAGAATTIGSVINACSSGRDVAVDAVGVAPAKSIRVGTYTSNGSLAWASPSVGVRVINTNGSGGGNDHAFDNLRIVDVTPQLDKEFVPAVTGVGQATTLRFTVTNTSELASKNGWSFTDKLPAGLTVASPNGTSTTCAAGTTISAPAGGTSVRIVGNLAAGAVSCTVSVQVVSSRAGELTNGADNLDPIESLNPPSTLARLQVVTTDFGDAPASYDTATTSHTELTGLRLGAERDAESTAFASSGATGDDTDRTLDDEDALSGAIDLRPDLPISQTVAVVNTTGAPATLAGWLDLDRDGDVNDPGERSTVVAVPAGATSTTLAWPARPTATPGPSILRLRLFAGALTDPRPSGAVSGGEIEDHAVRLQLPRVALTKIAGTVADPDGNGVDIGDTIAYSFRVTNSGSVGLDPITVTDPLLGGTVPCGTGMLAVGAVRDCSAVTYTLTQADVDGGVRANTATVSATPPTGPAVSAADGTTTPLDRAAGLALDKTADLDDADGDDLADVGETIAYTFTVTNVGNVTLSDVAVDDPLAGAVTCAPTTLLPRQVATCRAIRDYQVRQADVDRGAIDNTASATADDPTGTTRESPEDSSSVPAEVRRTLTVEKTASLADADADGLAEPGESISYAFLVTNTGSVTVTDVGVDDDLAGPVSCQTTSLAPRASTTCTADAPYLVTQTDLYSEAVDNTAAATGTAPSGAEVISPPDSTATPTADARPDLTIDKFATWTDRDDDDAIDVGEEISFAFRVTNTGNVTLDEVVVDDELAGPVTCEDRTLGPGASTTCTADSRYVITQRDVDRGQVTNTAAAAGTPPQGPAVESASDFTVTPADPDPAIDLVKTATVNPASGRYGLRAGDVISYRFTVTNTGNVSLTDVGVSDPTLGTVGCGDTTLVPGQQTSCEAPNRTVNQAQFDTGDPLPNNATASGEPPGGGTVIDESGVTLPVAAAAPALTIAKSASEGDTDEDGALEAGEQITYAFTITNVGDITVSDVAVSDPTVGPVTCTPTALTPGQDATCAADDPHIVTQTDVDEGRVVNTARATGDAGRGGPVISPPDTATVTIDATPGIGLVKTAELDDTNTNDVAELGETIRYGFAVTNSGSLTLTGVDVDDPALGPVSCTPTTLAPTEEATCTAAARRVVTQADLDAGGPVTNTATATGKPPRGAVVFDTASASVPIAAAPGIELTKVAVLDDTDDDGLADVGDTIGYRFTVTNTGAVTLTDVWVTDPTLGTVSCPTGPLSPGRDLSCTTGLTHTVTQADLDDGDPITNTATATATPPGGNDVTDGDDAATPVADADPALTLTKIGALADDDDGDLDVDDYIAYTFLVENTGTITIDDLVVTDPLVGTVRCPATTLSPGATTTCIAEMYLVTQEDVDAGQVSNTATVTGEPRRGTLADVSDTVRVPAAPRPGISLDKTAVLDDTDANLAADDGEVITYTFAVTNTGNVTLTDVGVADPAVGEVTCTPTRLAPAATATCLAARTRTVTQADLDGGGPLVNTATATGTPLRGDDVTDSDTATIPTAAAAASLDLVKEGVLVGDDDLEAGDTVGYTFTVTNTGNVSVDRLSIDDPRLERADDTIRCEATTLAPGARAVCTADYTVTRADERAGTVLNLATAAGLGPGDRPVLSNSSENLVTDDGDDDPGHHEPTHGVSSGVTRLPATGGPSGVLLIGGLAAAAAGGVLLLHQQRHRRRD